MKRILLLVLIISFFRINNVNAQSLPLTSSHSTCLKCLPQGWTSVQAGGMNAISNRVYHGIPEIPYIGYYPTIPGNPSLPPIPSGASTFLGMFGGWIKADITNLVVGQKYKIAYNIVSTRANYKTEFADYSNDFTEKVFFRIKQSGKLVALHEHEFNNAGAQGQHDYGIWRSSVFEFTAIATTASFELEPAQNDAGFIGLDLGPNALTPCGAGITAVPLKATSYEILCPATSVNLVSQFFGGLIPSGTELRFFTNPNHTGLPVSNMNVGAGTYYAFYYDAANNCYNQDVSTAKIDVTYRNCADITQTLDISAVNFNLGVSRDFVVNLYEINGSGTGGPVTFKIAKPGGFTITYPTVSGVSKVFGDVQNENGKWTFSENAGFITATSSVPIPANGQATIGFRIARKAGIAAGLSQNITVTVVGGSGGELNTENNLSITTVSTN